jgi:hypothetical protein
MWTYQQKSGCLWHDLDFVADGYSGKNAGLNNPLLQEVHNVGPIPQGIYKIVCWYPSDYELGPTVAVLVQVVGESFGRSGFRIHGDNSARNHTASEGCIILDHATRIRMQYSNDQVIEVTA